MSYSPRYDKGNWKAVCESCGRIVKASDLQRRWDGYMVDERCFEPRQPQDFVRGVADYQAPPFTRPEQSDSFIPFNFLQNCIKSVQSTCTMLVYKLPYKIWKLTISTHLTVSLTYAVSRSKTINKAVINKITLG